MVKDFNENIKFKITIEIFTFEQIGMDKEMLMNGGNVLIEEEESTN